VVSERKFVPSLYKLFEQPNENLRLTAYLSMDPCEFEGVFIRYFSVNNIDIGGLTAYSP
jgi:hypothetical protein